MQATRPEVTVCKKIKMPDIRISIKLPDPSKFSSQRFIDAIEKAQQDKIVPALKNLFRQTVEGWQNPPEFMSEKIRTPNSIGVRVFAGGPNAEKYALVVKGSPRHPIYPKNRGLLYFRPGYVPSTKPRVLSSRAYSRSGDYVSASKVDHPGFEAREFDQVIGEQHKPDFERDMQDAINDEAKS